MKRTIDGKVYLMRDQRPVRELRGLYNDYCLKFSSVMSFSDWLVARGKVYLQIRDRRSKN